MKNSITNIMFIHLIGMSCLEAAPLQTQSLNQLMEDTKNYKTTNTSFHAGNLYEHSIWVSMTIQKWFDEGSSWTQGLTIHDKKIACFAGLLHDIGKGGDLVYSFHTKPTHPERGQNYLLGSEQYTMANGKKFDFKTLLTSIGFSPEEQQIISILVGAHHAFGDLMMTLTSNSSLKDKYLAEKGFEKYLRALKTCAERAHYTKPLTERIIKLALLVAIADVKGAGPCDCHHSLVCSDFKTDKPPVRVHGASDKFIELGYDSWGKKLHEALLVYLEKKKVKI